MFLKKYSNTSDNYFYISGTETWQNQHKRRKCLRDIGFFSVESAVRKNTTKACEGEAIRLRADWKKGLSKPHL